VPDPLAVDAFGLRALERFYRVHARLYDWTRPFLLFGRGEAAGALGAAPGMLVLDVGCGTGASFRRLLGTGASILGVECSPSMRVRSAARIARLATSRIRLDVRPYGTHADYAGAVDRILFSYSLSMMPPFRDVLDRARHDLRPGGRIVVVDFLDASGPVALGLTASHVFLGADRLAALERSFPGHRTIVRNLGLWRYFLFTGER
jgi:S-adenosylmethionine-diacylgycerolhomoserine-N-methlytransferase